MSRISDLIAPSTDLEVEQVNLPKWGVVIEVRGLDGVKRSEFQQAMSRASESDDPTDSTAIEKALLVLSCFDPEADPPTPVFTEADVDMLWTKSGAYIGRLVQAALTVSGLTKASQEAMGKPLSASGTATTPSVDSTSTSPSN
jgi:hypothetical protein